MTKWDYRGPYGTIQDHTGPYRTIQDRTNLTIRDHMEPYGTKRDHIGYFLTLNDLFLSVLERLKSEVDRARQGFFMFVLLHPNISKV